jgi:hypothetical protein
MDMHVNQPWDKRLSPGVYNPFVYAIQGINFPDTRNSAVFQGNVQDSVRTGPGIDQAAAGN